MQRIDIADECRTQCQRREKWAEPFLLNIALGLRASAKGLDVELGKITCHGLAYDAGDGVQCGAIFEQQSMAVPEGVDDDARAILEDMLTLNDRYNGQVEHAIADDLAPPLPPDAVRL